MPYEGAEMSWVLLGEVLRGLAGYCAAVWNKRLLVFEVEVEGRGRVGAGRLWWFEGGGGGGGVVKKERGSE